MTIGDFSANAQFDRVLSVLMSDWDPIDIGGVVAAKDEYDDVASRIVGLLLSQASSASIAEELIRIETDDMGVKPDVTRATRVAVRLKSVVDAIEKSNVD
ncbi:MAG: hypothetical protein ABWZ80_00290 [Beijerinckiaceae bacterium]